jgi:hypothetical protein
MTDPGIKEKLTAAIDIVLQEGISKEPGATRFLAERILVLVADFTRKEMLAAGAQVAGVEKSETQIKMVVAHDDKVVSIEFGQPTAWISMPTAQALQFAFSVLEHCGVKIEHKIQQDPAPGAPI